MNKFIAFFKRLFTGRKFPKKRKNEKYNVKNLGESKDRQSILVDPGKYEE